MDEQKLSDQQHCGFHTSSFQPATSNLLANAECIREVPCHSVELSFMLAYDMEWKTVCFDFFGKKQKSVQFNRLIRSEGCFLFRTEDCCSCILLANISDLCFDLGISLASRSLIVIGKNEEVEYLSCLYSVSQEVILLWSVRSLLKFFRRQGA